MRAAFIFEKFTPNSDPITDMGIGLISSIRKEYEILQPKGLAERSWYLFDNKNYLGATLKIFDILTSILNMRKITNDKLQQIFNEIIGDTLLSAFGKKLVQKYFKKKFNIKFIINESLNEKFKEDSDPIVDLGIGLLGRFKREYNILKTKQGIERVRYMFNSPYYYRSTRAAFNILRNIIRTKAITQEQLNDVFHKEISKGNLSNIGIDLVQRYFKNKFNIDFTVYK